jgi:hypothetical protein
MLARNTEVDFSAPAAEAIIQKTAEALRENNFEAIVVDDGEAARRKVVELLSPGAEVDSGKSKTLEDIGVHQDLHESGLYDSVRSRRLAMDRATQAREIRKLGAAPDFQVGSAHAVTQSGQLVTASYSASQLGPLASGAGRVILVIGSQKIVRDLPEAFRRLEEHAVPYEDARLMEAMGRHTKVAKILINNLDVAPGRTTVILVREPVGA